MLSHKNFFRPKRWHEMVYDYKNIAERKKLMPLARNVKESITKETRSMLIWKDCPHLV